MTTISDVLARLETIIEWAKTNNSPMGYFPVVYHLMTKAVQHGIQTGAFEDGARMERLDVVFAQRYFDAFDAWQAGKPTTLAWYRAFYATKNDEPIVLQHILLGINAHIELDLGIAAGLVCPREKIRDMERDFNQINTIIAGLVDPVQERLAQIFPLMWVADKLFCKRDEHLANRLIGLGRSGAWAVAQTIANISEQLHPHAIEELDAVVAALARPIAAPPGNWLRAGLRVVRWAEWGSVSDKIEKLRGKMLWTDELLRQQ